MTERSMAEMWLVELALASFFSAAVITVGLLVWLRPLLNRYTLAKPNARSSHSRPTPQGGGIAVIVATTIITGLACSILAGQQQSASFGLAAVFLSAALLAAIGIVDDIRPIHAMPRLLFQSIAICIVLTALPIGSRILPVVPWWIDRVVLFVALLWFVNLTNFMDGIDWMTVVEVVPITIALTIF